MKSSWSDLPPELVNIIFNKLTEFDLDRFRAVCLNWRIYTSKPDSDHNQPTTTSSLTFPLRIPYPSFNPLFLVGYSVFLINPLSSTSSDGGTGGWLLFVEQSYSDDIRVSYPLSCDHVPELPTNFLDPLNRLNYNYVKISDGYVFRTVVKPALATQLCELCVAYKVVAFPDASSAEDFTAVVLYRQRWIGFVPKWGENWSFNTTAPGIMFDDIILFDGIVYGVGCTGLLYIIPQNRNEPLRIVDVSVEGVNIDCTRKRLVASSEGLYLVAKVASSSTERGRVRLFKLNEALGGWDKVTDIGDRVLFVGTFSCFFATAKNVSGCKPNTIVSRNNCLFRETGGESEIGVSVLDSCGKFGSYKAVSGLLWPPPSWFSPCPW